MQGERLENSAPKSSSQKPLQRTGNYLAKEASAENIQDVSGNLSQICSSLKLQVERH